MRIFIQINMPFYTKEPASGVESHALVFKKAVSKQYTVFSNKIK